MTTRRDFLRRAGVGAGSSLLGTLGGPFWSAAPTLAAPISSSPSFIVFLTDDQPQLGMGCMGNAAVQTPNMDHLASEGMLFTRAFVTTAICCSSRASILTGQYMRRHGIEDFAKPLSAAQWEQTYPALLRKGGYRTAYLGKFAVGSPNMVNEGLPLPADKFDLWYGFPQSIDYKQIVDGKPRYLTTIMTEKAVGFLRAQTPDRPFCLIVAFKEPHGPLNYMDPDVPDVNPNAVIPPPITLTQQSFDAVPEVVRNGLSGGKLGERWLKEPASYQQGMRTIYRYITRCDLAIGQIVRGLKDTGLDRNTVIIHTSDNGHMGGAHRLVGKWIMYEESILVPLIIRDPRLPVALRGRRCAEMALNIDLAPTILAMAGVPVPTRMQGADLSTLLHDPKAPWRDDWYYEHTYSPSPPGRLIPKCEGVRTRQWKYIRYPETKPLVEQLFNLASDPREEKDLAKDSSYADTLSKLRARCDGYRQTLR
jgi:arylsulfatase A-like enzyme